VGKENEPHQRSPPQRGGSIPASAGLIRGRSSQGHGCAERRRARLSCAVPAGAEAIAVVGSQRSRQPGPASGRGPATPLRPRKDRRRPSHRRAGGRSADRGRNRRPVAAVASSPAVRSRCASSSPSACGLLAGDRLVAIARPMRIVLPRCWCLMSAERLMRFNRVSAVSRPDLLSRHGGDRNRLVITSGDGPGRRCIPAHCGRIRCGLPGMVPRGCTGLSPIRQPGAHWGSDARPMARHGTRFPPARGAA
jgi:hypothetical protein